MGEVLDVENMRQSPIGAESSDGDLHANLDGPDDWEPWEDEELCASPITRAPDLSANTSTIMSSLKAMQVQVLEENLLEEKMNSVISMSRTCDNTANLIDESTKISKNDSKIIQELD